MRLGLSRTRRRIKGISLLFLVIFIITAGFLFLMYRLQPVFEEYGSVYANNMANSIVNSAVSEVMKNGEYSFTKFYETSNIFETNAVEINLLKADIGSKIREKISQSTGETVSIPLGNISGLYYLSSIGPEIPVRIYPASIIHTEFKDEFVSAGINQVKHKLYLEVTMEISFIGFAFSDKEEITSTALIFETVIVGDTPQYYGNGNFAVAAK